MSEPDDVTRPADADRGLVRYCDRTGREWTEPDPDVVWWEGPTECDLCGWTGRSAVKRASRSSCWSARAAPT